MRNIQSLSKFPDIFREQIIKMYEDDFKGNTPTGVLSSKHLYFILNDTQRDVINNMLPVPAYRIDLYVLTGHISAHIDRGRLTALQIPLSGCAEGNTYTFAAKEGEDKIIEIPPKNSIHVDGRPSPRFFCLTRNFTICTKVIRHIFRM